MDVDAEVGSGLVQGAGERPVALRQQRVGVAGAFAESEDPGGADGGGELAVEVLVGSGDGEVCAVDGGAADGDGGDVVEAVPPVGESDQQGSVGLPVGGQRVGSGGG